MTFEEFKKLKHGTKLSLITMRDEESFSGTGIKYVDSNGCMFILHNIKVRKGSTPYGSMPMEYEYSWQVDMVGDYQDWIEVKVLRKPITKKEINKLWIKKE